MNPHDEGLVTGAVAMCRAMMEGSHAGTVYAIVVNDEFVKIGFTKFPDARGRVGDIQKGCPYPFVVALEHCGGKPLEQALHAIFKDYHHRDEWFRYDGALKTFIAAISEK